VVDPQHHLAEAGKGGALGDAFHSLRTPLLGPHQLANATVAVATCWELARQGVAIEEQAVRTGLAAVVWPGRLEPLGDRVVVDSAHNDASARLLRQSLAHYYPGRPVTIILGVSSDKDAGAILAELCPGAASACLTRSRHPRATDPQELVPVAAQFLGAEYLTVAPSVGKALDWAESQVGPDGIICLTGSLFVAGEGREAWLARHPGGLPAEDWAYQAEVPAADWQVSQQPAGPALSPKAGQKGDGRL
jgi:dihydrofolate synthase/folylpolyglutamate synthase